MVRCYIITYKVIAVITLAFFLSFCVEYDNRLKIYNSSNNVIFYEISEDSCFENIFIYYAEQKVNYPCFDESSRIEKKDSTFSLTINSWPKRIKHLKDHSLWIYFFSINDVKYYPCDTIRKYRKFIERKKVSLEELEKSNWTITYP